MSNFLTTRGLVLKESAYRDSGKILTILTEHEGKITVSARGAKRKGSRIAAVSQFLSFSNITLSHSREHWYLNEGVTIELFSGLRNDVVKLALGAYFSELLDAAANEGLCDPNLLKLGVNSLYALSYGTRIPDIIKSSYEMRLMCLSGYTPMIEHCALCGDNSDALLCFDIANGYLLCVRCRYMNQGIIKELCPASLKALRYVVNAEPSKIFSFSLDNGALVKLAALTESYVEIQLEKQFQTLKFYKDLTMSF